MNEKCYSSTAVAVVEQGCFAYFGQAGRSIAAPGTILFGNAGDRFACRHYDDMGNRRSVVAFSKALLMEVAEEAEIGAPRFAVTMLPPAPHHAALGAVIRSLVRNEAVAEDMAFELATMALTIGRKQSCVPGSSRDVKRIVTVIRYIECHFAQPCGLAALAEIAGVSRFHFLRLFRAATGVSPTQFVIALRLRAASERLCSTFDPVTHIAFDTGFNDLSHFNQLFRRSFGIAPLRWRAKNAIPSVRVTGCKLQTH